MTTLLLDGDHLLYTACAAVEREVQFDAQNHVLWSNAAEALEASKRVIENKLNTLCVGDPILIFTGTGNFRKDLSDTYKSGRGRKPLAYARVRDELEGLYACEFIDGIEGDDLMGILATNGSLDDVIIVADDKDLRTIPGQLYAHGELLTISEDEANYNWLLQTLTGDATDGYSGCPGIGPVKAAKVLTKAEFDWCANLVTLKGSFGFLWQAVVETFVAAGLTEEDALLQARLARILRATDWDAETGRVKLWTPQ